MNVVDYAKRGRRAPRPPLPAVPEGETPVVEVTRKITRRGALLLIVKACPWCGETHAHGAVSATFGAGDGSRRSHCYTVEPREYVLREVKVAPAAQAEEANR